MLQKSNKNKIHVLFLFSIASRLVPNIIGNIFDYKPNIGPFTGLVEIYKIFVIVDFCSPFAKNIIFFLIYFYYTNQKS